tara:strand:+ start:232 stop:1347 length:1116 start_codon:yes stop_codon:yes gene_type:complete
MIPVSIPYVAKNQKKYVDDCIERNWISAFGKYDKKLSDNFSNFIGTKFSSTCSNGTVAIHLALLACEVKPGDEIIVPNFNGPYALFAVSYVQASPVFIDVDENWDINLDELKTAISKKTKAIIIPHLYGVPSNANKLKEICNENNIFIIEDCAEAHGAKDGSDVVGSIGDIGSFSFYANKIIASGEGGILTTSNSELYEKIEYFKNQTFNKGPIKTFIHEHPGYNYRMSDIHCAIAFSHLEEIDKIIYERQKILDLYRECLSEYSSFFQMHKDKVSTVNWVTTFQLPFNNIEYRNQLEKYLNDNDVQCRRFFAPMHIQPFLSDMNYRIIGNLEFSNKICASGIYLPTYIGMTKEQIMDISSLIRIFLDKKI